MLAPFCHVLLFLERDQLLPLQILKHSLTEIITRVFVFFNKHFSLRVAPFQVLLPLAHHGVQVLDDLASELVRKGLLSARFDQVHFLKCLSFLLSLSIVGKGQIAEVLWIQLKIILEFDEEVHTLAKSNRTELNIEGST